MAIYVQTVLFVAYFEQTAEFVYLLECTYTSYNCWLKNKSFSIAYSYNPTVVIRDKVQTTRTKLSFLSELIFLLPLSLKHLIIIIIHCTLETELKQ